ncbi:MAG: FtsX-like permease family protein [Bacteroidales bacterium]
MSFPFYIARRYLLAKKSHNAINIISIIAVVGVTIGTMALIVILSVFNGFDRVVKSLLNSFDPDYSLSLVEGKVFTPDSLQLAALGQVPGVAAWSAVLEENAVLKYEDKQYITTIKGVDSSYTHVTDVPQSMFEGTFKLRNGELPYAVVGQGVQLYLGIVLQSEKPVLVYMPRRLGNVSLNPEQALRRNFFLVSGVFRIEQDFDSKYTFVTLDYLQNLLEYRHEISAIELRMQAGADPVKVRKEIEKIFGPEFRLKDRMQQQEFLYKIMRSEKWAIFFILTFVLVIASFNIIGSLSMLILDKKTDIAVLAGMGASPQMIRKIFLVEGWLISISGAIAGLFLGGLVCWLQMKYEWLKLQGSGSFVIDAYPVHMRWPDFLIIFITVISIGYLAAWYPVRFITRKKLVEFSNL